MSTVTPSRRFDLDTATRAVPAATEAPAVVARDLELIYPSGAKALDGVSLQVAAREHVAILGSSGSG